MPYVLIAGAAIGLSIFAAVEDNSAQKNNNVIHVCFGSTTVQATFNPGSANYRPDTDPKNLEEVAKANNDVFTGLGEIVCKQGATFYLTKDGQDLKQQYDVLHSNSANTPQP